MTQSSLTYRVSSNGAAGDWYWEVRSGETILDRGLASDNVRARVEALLAAASYIDKSARDLDEQPGA